MEAIYNCRSISQPLRYESSLERKSILSKDNNQGLDKDMILKMRVDNIKRFISSNYRASKPMRFISFEKKISQKAAPYYKKYHGMIKQIGMSTKCLKLKEKDLDEKNNLPNVIDLDTLKIQKMLKERKTFVYKNRCLRNFEDRIVAPLKHKLSEESMKTMEDDIVKNIENIDSKIQNTFIKQLQKSQSNLIINTNPQFEISKIPQSVKGSRRCLNEYFKQFRTHKNNQLIESDRK